ncbi:hypothetical protein, partial [Algoriphagus aquimarinus]|uniref:hypothetical protein n=1 Tax=Algoriphagus aquimarinus TaxID=237018 RepID=UPI0030DCD4FA
LFNFPQIYTDNYRRFSQIRVHVPFSYLHKKISVNLRVFYAKICGKLSTLFYQTSSAGNNFKKT